MSKQFNEEIKLKVLKAYLVDGLSHRQIQREILNLPAPARGGGFKAMEILHQYGITGEYKALYANSSADDFIKKTASTDLYEALSNYIKTTKEAEEQIDKKQFSYEYKETERNTNIKLRVYQDVLRERVLKNYNGECAFCDINQQDLLICSHIKPWASEINNRLNPQNAICLCALHDKLFDKGYFSLDANYEVIFSEKADLIVKKVFGNYKFKTPFRELPDYEFLKFHQKEICGIEK